MKYIVTKALYILMFWILSIVISYLWKGNVVYNNVENAAFMLLVGIVISNTVDSSVRK